MILLTGFALLAVNVMTFMLFGDDKARAIAGQRRIPEAELLGLALLGGTPAAFLARAHFRHKTRKQPFSTQLICIAIVHAGMVAGVGWSLVETALQS